MARFEDVPGEIVDPVAIAYYESTGYKRLDDDEEPAPKAEPRKHVPKT